MYLSSFESENNKFLIIILMNKNIPLELRERARVDARSVERHANDPPLWRRRGLIDAHAVDL